MSTNLLLLLGVGGVAVWALTRTPAAATPAVAPAGTPPPYWPSPYAASQNPAMPTNYYQSKAQDAASVINAIGGIFGTAAGIYQTSQQASNSGYSGD